MSQKPKQVQNAPGTGRRYRGQRPNGNGNRMLDVNPQLLYVRVDQTVVNTFTQASVKTPITTQLPNGQALVMEILKVYITTTYMEIKALTAQDMSWGVYGTSRSALDASRNDSYVNDGKVIQQVYPRTAEGFVLESRKMVSYDLTDGNGNGMLHAGQDIFIGISTAGCNAGAFHTAEAKILYRLKQVGANELIGMLRN